MSRCYHLWVGAQNYHQDLHAGLYGWFLFVCFFLTPGSLAMLLRPAFHLMWNVSGLPRKCLGMLGRLGIHLQFSFPLWKPWALRKPLCEALCWVGEAKGQCSQNELLSLFFLYSVSYILWTIQANSPPAPTFFWFLQFYQGVCVNVDSC
jgi:hypothetical protein